MKSYTGHDRRESERCYSTVRVADQSAMSHVQQHTREASKGVGSQTSESTDAEWLDEVFALLSNSRRRHAIQIMMEHERMDFGELVDRVAELEYQLPIDDISSDERHTVYVSLSQSHRPRLEKAGVIECERDTGTVSLGPRSDDLAEWLSHIDGSDGLGSKLKRSLSALC